MLIFCGGLPQEHSGDHHAITIMHGVQHVALDFSSPVVDIFAINGELNILPIYPGLVTVDKH